MPDRKTIPLDGPPTLRRPMGPGLDRHHVIGFVGIVAHFPSAFSLFHHPQTISLGEALCCRDNISAVENGKHLLHRYFGVARVWFNNIFRRDVSLLGAGSQDDLLVSHSSTSYERTTP